MESIRLKLFSLLLLLCFVGGSRLAMAENIYTVDSDTELQSVIVAIEENNAISSAEIRFTTPGAYRIENVFTKNITFVNKVMGNDGNPDVDAVVITENQEVWRCYFDNSGCFKDLTILEWNNGGFYAGGLLTFDNCKITGRSYLEGNIRYDNCELVLKYDEEFDMYSGTVLFVKECNVELNNCTTNIPDISIENYYSIIDEENATVKIDGVLVYPESGTDVYQARIGDVEYSSVEEAFEAVEDGQTITLLNDVELSSPIEYYGDGKTFTFDLNEHTITLTGENWTAFDIESPSNITFKNGTIANGNESGNVYALIYACADGDERGKITFENMTFDASGLTDDCLYIDEGLDVAFAGENSVINAECGAFSIIDGKVEIVDGAKFNQALAMNLENYVNMSFEEESTSDWYVPVGITADKAIASIGEGTEVKYFKNIAIAFVEVEDGQTITLLKDVELSSPIEYYEEGKTFTFDLNEHTITLTGENWTAFDIESPSNITFKNGTIANGNESGDVGDLIYAWADGDGRGKITFVDMAFDAPGLTDDCLYIDEGFDVAFAGKNSVINAEFGVFYLANGKVEIADGAKFNQELAMDVEDFVNQKFEKESDSDWYIPVDLTEEDAIAKIGEGDEVKYFKNIAKAFEAVEDGQTITLLNDVELSSLIEYYEDAKTFTFDLNEHTITFTGENWTAFYIKSPSNITFKNGTIVNGNKNSEVWYLIQAWLDKDKYGDERGKITLEDMTLDASGLNYICLYIDEGFDVAFAGKNSVINAEFGAFYLFNGKAEIADGAKFNQALAAADVLKYLTHGTLVPDENKEWWTFVAPTPVAQIGEEVYYSLEEAFEAVEDDETITLLKDISNSDCIEDLTSTYRTFTVDFNGHTYTYTGTHWTGFYFKSASDITFKNGCITNSESNSDYVESLLYGDKVKFTLDNMAFDATHTKAMTNAGCVDFREYADVTFTGNTSITGMADGGYALYFHSCDAVNWESSGLVEGDVYIHNCNFNIYSGKFDGSLLRPSSYSISYYIIYGGQFSDNPSYYLSPEYVVKYDGTKWYTVKECQAVARIGDETYNTLGAAVEYVEDGETIYLLDDVWEEYGFHLGASGGGEPDNRSFTIDFNGHIYAVGNDTYQFSSCAFWLYSTGDITFENGYLTTSNDVEAYILIKNMTNSLTLKNMTLSTANLEHDYNEHCVAIFGNPAIIVDASVKARPAMAESQPESNSIYFLGETNIETLKGDVAISLAKNVKANWESTGTVAGDCKIEGEMSISDGKFLGNLEVAENSVVEISDGKFYGELNVDNNGTVEISGGSFKANPEEYVTEGNDTYYADGLYSVESVTLTISSVGWATACIPFDSKLKASGITAYYVTVADGKLVKTPVEGAIPAGTGVLLEGVSGNNSDVTFYKADITEADRIAATDNLLVGTLQEGGDTFADATATFYKLANDSERGIGFYWDGKISHDHGGHSAFCPQYKALLKIDGSLDVKGFGIDEFEEGIIVGIGNVMNGNNKNNGVIYNLSGQRLNGLQKGVNIVNGKKILVK